MRKEKWYYKTFFKGSEDYEYIAKKLANYLNEENINDFKVVLMLKDRDLGGSYLEIVYKK